MGLLRVHSRANDGLEQTSKVEITITANMIELLMSYKRKCTFLPTGFLTATSVTANSTCFVLISDKYRLRVVGRFTQSEHLPTQSSLLIIIVFYSRQTLRWSLCPGSLYYSQSTTTQYPSSHIWQSAARSYTPAPV